MGLKSKASAEVLLLCILYMASREGVLDVCGFQDCVFITFPSMLTFFIYCFKDFLILHYFVFLFSFQLHCKNTIKIQTFHTLIFRVLRQFNAVSADATEGKMNINSTLLDIAMVDYNTFSLVSAKTHGNMNVYYKSLI